MIPIAIGRTDNYEFDYVNPNSIFRFTAYFNDREEFSMALKKFDPILRKMVLCSQGSIDDIPYMEKIYGIRKIKIEIHNSKGKIIETRNFKVRGQTKCIDDKLNCSKIVIFENIEEI